MGRAVGRCAGGPRADGWDEMSERITAETLADAYPLEQERVRELLARAQEIPPQSGFFYVAVCEAALREADQAALSGDVVAMLRAYKAMKEIEA